MVTSILLAKHKQRSNLTAMMIRDVMGTNSQTGTTDKEMKQGLDAFGIQYTRAIPAQNVGPQRLQDLENWLRSGGLAMLRVMKHNCRHWLVACGIEGNNVWILDPAGGSYASSLRDVDKMLAPRGWEFWTIPADSPCHAFIYGPLLRFNDQPGQILQTAAEILGPVFPHLGADGYRPIDLRSVNLDESQALRVGDDLVGVYALNRHPPNLALHLAGYDETISNSITDYLKKNFHGHGCETLAFAIRDDFQGKGLARLLRALPSQAGFEWNYSLQPKSISGIERWKDKSAFTVDLGDAWFTAGPIERILPKTISAHSTAHVAEYPSSRSSHGFKSS
jgi:hypothetical protein